MLKRLRDSEFSDRAEDIRGATLYGSNNEKIGTIDDVVFDPASYTARYAIVDAGGWLSSRKFLVPIDQIRTDRNDEDAFHIALTKQQIEDLPRFEDDLLKSDASFADYENRYRTKWSSYGLAMPTSRSARLVRFESNLRTRGIQAGPGPVATTRVPAVSSTSNNPVSGTTGNNVSSAASSVSVYGVYSDHAQLEKAVARLKEQGFQSGDISVVFPDKGRTDRFAMEHNTKAPEGAATGGGTGLVVGGVLGWLAGIGTLAIPGIGPLLAAGPIVAALAGAGVGGAIGGLAGALIGMGMPEIEAKRYEKEIREGRMMIAVRCYDPRYVASARSVLVDTDAKDVFQTGERLAA